MGDAFMDVISDELDGDVDDDDDDENIEVAGTSTPDSSSRGAVHTPDAKEPREKKARYHLSLDETRVTAGTACQCIFLER